MTRTEELYYREKLRSISWYLVIGFVSIISTVFLPMVGSEGDVVSKLPSTPLGWVVWSIAKLSTAIINVVLFHSFIKQANINIRDDKKYKAAKKAYLASEDKKKGLNPRSPRKFFGKEYSVKATSVLLFTAIALIGLENMILRFDLASFLSYIFTVFMGLLFGFIEMKKVEDYWCEEFPEYVENVLQIKLNVEEDTKEGE